MFEDLEKLASVSDEKSGAWKALQKQDASARAVISHIRQLGAVVNALAVHPGPNATEEEIESASNKLVGYLADTSKQLAEKITMPMSADFKTIAVFNAIRTPITEGWKRHGEGVMSKDWIGLLKQVLESVNRLSPGVEALFGEVEGQKPTFEEMPFHMIALNPKLSNLRFQISLFGYWHDKGELYDQLVARIMNDASDVVLGLEREGAVLAPDRHQAPVTNAVVGELADILGRCFKHYEKPVREHVSSMDANSKVRTRSEGYDLSQLLRLYEGQRNMFVSSLMATQQLQNRQSVESAHRAGLGATV